MGVLDATARDYLSKNMYFADTFNFLMYDGQEVVKAGELRELDTAGLAMPYGRGARFPVSRSRDILKLWGAKEDGGMAYLMLGIEEQSKVHYGMPVRCALYDAISYASQISAIAQSYKDKKKDRGEDGEADIYVDDGKVVIKPTSEEYLSGLRKGDRLVPVVTAVVYLGAEPWDGPMSVHDILDFPNERAPKFVPDYWMNLVAPSAMTDADFGKFNTDLGFAMDLLAHRREAARVIGARGHKRVDNETARFVREASGLKLQIKEGAEGVDMQGVLDEWMAAERRKYEEAARSEVEAERREVEVKAVVATGRLNGISYKDIVSSVVQVCGIDRDSAEQYVRAMA